MRSRLQWVGYVERMADDRLPKRAGQEETRETKAEMGGLGKERCEEDRRGGRLEQEDKRQTRVEKTISDEAVKKLRAAPHPGQREKRKREM